MKPIYLTIHAWGPYKEKEIVDFKHLTDRGVFLISGPTGAGKTTIFDAITFALFGEVSGSIREKEGVRSDFADPEAETYVKLEFTHRNETYEIERNPKYFRPKKRGSGFVAVKENAVLRTKEKVLAEGAREVTTKIEELLALNYKQFTQISMLAQGEFQKLLTTSGNERTKIFRNLFHTEICEKLQNTLTEKCKKKQEELKENQTRMGEILATVLCETQEWKELVNRGVGNTQAVQDYLKEDLEKIKEKWEQAKQQYEECTVVIKEGIKQKEEAKYQIELNKKKETIEKQLLLLEEKRTEYERQKGDLQIVEKAEKVLLTEAEYLRCVALKKKLEKELERLAVQEKEKEKLWKVWEEKYQKNPERKKLVTELQEMVRKIEVKKKQEAELEILKRELKISQEEFLKRQQEKQEKKELYEQAEKTYKMATAGLLAKELEENVPCPVCGSLSHPKKAKLSEEVPDKAYLEGLKEKYEKALEKENVSHTKTVEIRSKIQILKENIEGISLSWQGEELEELRRAKKKEQEKLTEEIENTDKNYQQAMVAYENVCNLHKVRKEEWADCKNTTQEAEKRYKETLSEYGFSNQEEFLTVKEKSVYREQYAKAVREYEEKVLLYNERKENLDYELGKRKYIDFEDISERLANAEVKEKELRKELTELQGCYKNNKRAYENLVEKSRTLESLASEYGKISRMENVTKGRNSKNLVFEQYILSCYFDKILQAANQRLEGMTSGRFFLKRVDQAEDARSRDSLYMEVFDAYTGKTRGVQSLSGGEAFKASLSLALGMSDMIQTLSGGIVVETLFVDEGFGSLDEESLEQAVEVLMNLAKKEYTIGIISHVKELKEKVEKQLIVERCRTGSRIVS